MVRVSLRYGALDAVGGDPPEEARRARIERLHSGPEAEIFDVRWVEAPLPSMARLFKSVRCSQCGEGVMKARAHLRDGQLVCPECYGEVYHRGW